MESASDFEIEGRDSGIGSSYIAIEVFKCDLVREGLLPLYVLSAVVF
jgi:hypothetical protein